MIVRDANGNEQEVPRATASDLFDKNGKIYIDSKFFKIRSQSRRDAVLQHEIGHSKLHSANAESDKLDKEMMSKEVIVNTLSSIIDQNIDAYGFSDLYTASELKDLKKQAMYQLENNIKKYVNKIPNDTSGRQKLRAEVREILKKYQHGGHTNVNEFEADRYAANKTSKKDLKAGLRDASRQERKKIKKNVKSYENERMNDKEGSSVKEIKRESKKIVADYNTKLQKDMDQRAKALNDKSLSQKQKQNYR